MKFYVTQVSNLKDGTTPIATFQKESLIDAEIYYHQVLASMLADSQNVVSGFCTILDETGRQIPEYHKFYMNPIPILDPVEPESEPEE